MNHVPSGSSDHLRREAKTLGRRLKKSKTTKPRMAADESGPFSGKTAKVGTEMGTGKRGTAGTKKRR